MENINFLYQDICSKIDKADSISALEKIRINILGRKGSITCLIKDNCKIKKNIDFLQKINCLKKKVQIYLQERKKLIEIKNIERRIVQEKVDVTLPSRKEHSIGLIHPITHTLNEIISIFNYMGFSVAEGPDIEDEYHNFSALNIPKEHPARAMQDTFYLSDEDDKSNLHKLLRTHTSPVQIRAMKTMKVPLRIIAPGRTYRSDSDITHTPMFHQIEGLVIDEKQKVHMGHLKGCLLEFLKTYFNIESLPVRYRPSFFPFTEPSAEIDIGCLRKNGEIKIGKGNEWLEVLGCGMVHINVLKACKINTKKYQGFAFGIGIERLAMLKYGISDLRKFFSIDIRWLKHYGFLYR